MVDGTTMRALLTSLFGSYTPPVDPSGVPLAGVAGVDWPWVCGVLLFALLLWGFLRLLVGIFRR